MKGLSEISVPVLTQTNDRDIWITEASGPVNNLPSKVLLATIPIKDIKHSKIENHIAQYIVMVWCPQESFATNEEMMQEVLMSAVIWD